MDARDLIVRLGLSPLPVEGGYFRETWRGDEIPLDAARSEPVRHFGTAIYYLLTDDADSFSALHRLPTDEVYHFYLGDPVQQLLLHPGGRHDVITLGQNLNAGQRVQSVAPRAVWQGSRLVPGGRFALLGTTMAPGFTSSDYVGGRRDELLREYPFAADLIVALTRTS
jgi:predicted cupin superfamily sugar epimerase